MNASPHRTPRTISGVRSTAPPRRTRRTPLGRGRNTSSGLLAALALLLLSTGCLTAGPRPLPGEPPLPREPLAEGEFAAQLEAGRAALAEGRPWHAAARGMALRSVSSLAPEERSQAEVLLETAVAHAARRAERSREFSVLPARRLPRRPQAIHAVGRARLLVEERRPFGAYLAIRELEDQYPTHHLRPEAGQVVADAGFSMARDGLRYLLLLRERTRAPQVLEYLVLRHPANPRCAEAYAELASMYEQRQDYPNAIERHQDLLLYHPNSPFAVLSELEVPRLRLLRLGRADYDRSEFTRARSEVERWLQRHDPASVDPEVWAHARALHADCTERLVRGDLGVARFYRRVGQPVGARLHADRALAWAAEGELEDLAAEARELLEELGSAPAGAVEADA